MKTIYKSALALAFFAVPTTSHAASEPQQIAKDFCHAVAAQALCRKTFVMHKGTEAKMSKLAGQKLRGSSTPLNAQCEAGYNEFYDMEGSQGLEAACQTTLGLFGPEGTRRAGLVFGRSAPAMKLPEEQVEGMFKAVCYAEQAAKACPTLNMVPAHNRLLQSTTGVSPKEKRKYFAKACGQGVFSASLLKGKVELNTFCRRAEQDYGAQGIKYAGLLVPDPDTATTQSSGDDITANAQAAANAAISEVVDQVCTALVTARTAAEHCPGASAIIGLEDLLQIHLGKQVGKISERCAAVEKPNVTASNKAQFCRKAVAAYGPKGSDYPGMIRLSESAAAAATQTAAATPANTGSELVILQSIPARAPGTDIIKTLGAEPGTLSGQACEPFVADVNQAKASLAAAVSLKDKVTASIELVAKGMIGQKLCPSQITFTPPTGIADEVAATGLEACHIVDESARVLTKRGYEYSREKLYTAIIANDDAIVWSYKTFAPTCSKLMKRRIESALKFADKNAERNRSRYTCRAWTEQARTEMKTAEGLARDRKYRDAIAALDNRVLAAIHGVEENCDERNAKYPRERWLSSRKRYQTRL